MTEAIKIEGLKEFTRDLKRIDSDLPKLVRLANNAAANLVVDDARPRVPTGPHGGRARKSVKAASTRTKSRVSGGGGRAQYYPWLDFGGKVGRRGSVKRAYKPKGRYIYRAYFQARDSGEFLEIMTKELVDVARQAGIDVES